MIMKLTSKQALKFRNGDSGGYETITLDPFKNGQNKLTTFFSVTYLQPREKPFMENLVSCNFLRKIEDV